MKFKHYRHNTTFDCSETKQDLVTDLLNNCVCFSTVPNLLKQIPIKTHKTYSAKITESLKFYHVTHMENLGEFTSAICDDQMCLSLTHLKICRLTTVINAI